MKNKIFLGDCLDIMPNFESKSVDLILADLPYGTTDCFWDSIIPLNLLWEQYERIIKDNGNIVLFSSQPFTSVLVSSNISLYKYDYVWEKSNHSNPFIAKNQPLRIYENISVFYKDFTNSKIKEIYFKELKKYFQRILNESGFTRNGIIKSYGERVSRCFRTDKNWAIPSKDTYFNLVSSLQIVDYLEYEEILYLYEEERNKIRSTFNIETREVSKKSRTTSSSIFGRDNITHKNYEQVETGYLKNILKFDLDEERFHPTQKPLALLEKLISIYSNKGDLVLDNVFGSGNTLLAAKNINRFYVGIEKEKKYYDIAVERLR